MAPFGGGSASRARALSPVRRRSVTRPRAGRAVEPLPSAAVSTATKAAAPTGSLLDRIEQTAWRVPLPTRKLFVTLALVVAGALAVSGLAAGWVASRNANTIADAREQGLELATATTDFRTNLAEADALAAATLIAGGLESTDSRSAYDAALLEASQALTEAGLVATEDDREDISAMASGLVEYAGLVETSRANTRLGYPVGSAYLNQARDLANDDLTVRADTLRRTGERRMAQAANSVGGILGILAIVLLLAALVVLIGCSLLIAGRTRRATHPALLAAAVAAIAALALVANGIVSQSRELREAASSDIQGYIDANTASSELSRLRVIEISAVAARGSGAPLYQDFEDGSATLIAELGAGDDPAMSELRGRVESYASAVAGVAEADLGGNNQRAAELALSLEPDGSAGAYNLASVGPEVDDDGDGRPDAPVPGSAAGNVRSEADALEARFDDVAAADIHPLVPIALGVVAAILAASGILARGRKYR